MPVIVKNKAERVKENKRATKRASKWSNALSNMSDDEIPKEDYEEEGGTDQEEEAEVREVLIEDLHVPTAPAPHKKHGSDWEHGPSRGFEASAIEVSRRCGRKQQQFYPPKMWKGAFVELE